MKISVNESSFGSSTSAEVFFKGNRVVHTLDTSTNETNYVWDGWGDFLHSVIGMKKDVFKKSCNHFFDEFEDEYRKPYICIHE